MHGPEQWICKRELYFSCFQRFERALCVHAVLQRECQRYAEVERGSVESESVSPETEVNFNILNYFVNFCGTYEQLDWKCEWTRQHSSICA